MKPVNKVTRLMGDDPLSSEAILEQFYRPAAEPVAEPRPDKAKPTHYKVVCISLYTEDIARLEAMVAELKHRGHTKANKSAVIRFALDSCDLAKMPKGY